MAKVAIIRCETYDYANVKDAVDRGIKIVGGVDAFAKKGETILLKPNLLVAELPEKCVTTHPAVFRAAAEALISAGAAVTYGDSPAIGNTKGAARKCGIKDVADRLGIHLADFKTSEEIFFAQGRQNKKFTIAKGVLESDGVISLPKLKTHALERMTGCIKNQFGCVPGVLKGEYHVKLPDANDFAKMLVDLDRLVHPRLYIMDGITGMDGGGPRGGNPKKMNVLLFSDDPVALDATVCRLVDLNPEYVPTIRYGMDFGAGTYREDEIDLLGDDIRSFKSTNFNVVRSPVQPYSGSGFKRRLISNLLVPKPYIIEKRCVQCGLCVTMCPSDPKAVNWHDGDTSKPPVYNYKRCIRCYCCQELCPEKAIKLNVPPVRRFLRYVAP